MCASLELGRTSQADMVATRADSSSTLRGSEFLVQGLGGFLGPLDGWGFQGRPRKRSVPRASRRAKKYALRSTVGRSTCAGLSPPSQDESSGTRGALVALRFPTFWALRLRVFFFFFSLPPPSAESGGSPGGRGDIAAVEKKRVGVGALLNPLNPRRARRRKLTREIYCAATDHVEALQFFFHTAIPTLRIAKLFFLSRE